MSHNSKTAVYKKYGHGSNLQTITEFSGGTELNYNYDRRNHLKNVNQSVMVEQRHRVGQSVQEGKNIPNIQTLSQDILQLFLNLSIHILFLI